MYQPVEQIAEPATRDQRKRAGPPLIKALCTDRRKHQSHQQRPNGRGEENKSKVL
jgi:hypothetical protein